MVQPIAVECGMPAKPARCSRRIRRAAVLKASISPVLVPRRGLAQGSTRVVGRATMRDLTEGCQAWLYPPAREDAMKRRPKPVHQMTVAQFEAIFTDEEACRRYL